MVFNFLSGNHRTANIILKDHVIRYIELKQTSPIIVNHSAERYIPEGLIRDGKIIDRDTLSTILEECIEDWGIKKRNVRFTVPDAFVVIRTVQVPGDLEDDEVKGYLYLELGTTIHLPFEDPVFDAIVIKDSGEKKDVLLFAAPEEIVTQYSELFSELKLKPTSADISALCLYRLYFEIENPRNNQHIMLVQFDIHMVNISIFHNHKPIFMRHLPIEGIYENWDNHYTTSGEHQYQWVGDEQELSMQLLDVYKEIENVMNFYRFSLKQGKEGIERIYLCGDYPLFRKVAKDVKERFDLPVDTIDSEKVATSNGEQIPQQLHLALGLALKEVR
ncbi:pilus assembly protein PilM [Bacillus luteolus]|uniref:Pilus assembly protein PilM n=1 Tax=Litchfieldia luteola TaxID=682179 RepID=A0ABR9QI32_9BACI|nr:pilus assembly protein PilM [Cytobacillus luteolus]MBE4908150.1 pilus assembly protein PilM [Cytobacillus luteolus]MBP1942935.1 type IV pilus assembly protein PilM [Cytobacillus luteolus]